MRRGDPRVAVLALLFGAITLVNLVLLAQPSLHPTGLSASTATVGLVIMGTCSGPVVQGWNFISFCAQLPDPAIVSVLSGIDYRYVMRWNESAQQFDVYSPNAASNPFDAFEINRSYFLYLNSGPDIITPSGGFNDDLNITLTPGWSTPSWPFESNVNFTRYLNETVHRYHMKWNSTTQQFVIWSPRMANPPASVMFVGDGQFIYSENANTLNYNKTNLTG
ncbi:MAG TPA: hypothetical protein VLJ21_03190 [Candidatus Binatia bacterium]|nr:hypothetical protein [Candidatus Binatia bacterium]